MSATERKHKEILQQTLQEVKRLLGRQRLVEDMVHKQDMPKHDLVENLVHKQNLVELSHRLEALAPADIAGIIEALPHADRSLVIGLIPVERLGLVLLELSNSVREVVLVGIEQPTLDTMAQSMEWEKLVRLASKLPAPRLAPLLESLEEARREELQSALSVRQIPIGSIKAFVLQAGRLMQLPNLTADDLLRPDILWVDMVDPTDDERELVQSSFRLELPEDEELEDIEESARCYIDEHGLHISSFFLHKDDSEASNVTVSFTLHAGRLLTIRQEELAVFRLFRLRARVQPGMVANAQDILLAIFDAAVEYDADMLEAVYNDLEPISQRVLNHSNEMDDQGMAETVARLATYEDINGKVRLDLMDTRRALSFLLRSRTLAAEQEANLREILRDLESLNNHTGFLFDKVNFLMDAVMGLINLAQNTIIRRLTVLSVVFMPLNVVAGIGGMSEFSMMTQGIPWPIAYGSFVVGMLSIAGITLLILRHYENRKKNRFKQRQ